MIALLVGFAALLQTSAIAGSSRAVFYNQCWFQVPRGEGLDTRVTTSCYGRSGKEARAAAYEHCKRVLDAAHPGACDRAWNAGASTSCDFGVWIMSAQTCSVQYN